MAEGTRTCANCGNVQATGDFCERCGTRLPPVVAQAPPGAGPAQTPPPPAGPPPYGGAYGAPPPAAVPPQYGYADYAREKGFFGRLFDFSFRQFITPSIIKVLFIISIVVICLGVLAGIVMGFTHSVGLGFVFLIGGLIYGFLMLLYVRVLLEIFIVFFRIYDNTLDIAKSKR